MSELATVDQLQEAADAVRGYVDGHEATTYTSHAGSFLVCYTRLEVPRVIGERTANFLRLFKGISSDALAGALYNELGLEPVINSEVYPELPVRSVIIREDLPLSTYSFNGTFDANEYPVPAGVAVALVEDVATAVQTA